MNIVYIAWAIRSYVAIGNKRTKDRSIIGIYDNETDAVNKATETWTKHMEESEWDFKAAVMTWTVGSHLQGETVWTSSSLLWDKKD